MGTMGFSTYLFFTVFLVLWDYSHCAKDQKLLQRNPGSSQQFPSPKKFAHGTYWLNATFRAEDAGLNLTVLCQPLKSYWKAQKGSKEVDFNSTTETLNSTTFVANNESLKIDDAVVVNFTEPEVILWLTNRTTAANLGLNISLLDEYEHVAVDMGEACMMRSRVLWLNTSKDAVTYGLNKTIICIPFDSKSGHSNTSEVEQALQQLGQPSNLRSNSHDSHNKPKGKRKPRDDHSHVPDKNHKAHVQEASETGSNNTHIASGLSLNASNAADTVLHVSNADGARTLDLDPGLLEQHESISIYLPGACQAIEEPHTIKNINVSEVLGVDVGQAIGIDVSKINANLTELEETSKNDTHLDAILRTFNETTGERMLGGSFILPFLKKGDGYDKASPPSVFENQTITVRIGFYVESIANFKTDSMDYEMDMYFRMAWRDPRLINNLNQTINVKEQEIRDMLWLPDPYFPNAKEASFHEVTFLNFLLRILPGGEVFYMIRIKLKPSCHLSLCKFPHDNQRCTLQIKSFAYPADYLRFEWFSDMEDAISMNKNIEFSELQIVGKKKEECDGSNQIGNFTCIQAVFFLERDLGFYIAQMYIPTTLALMFSWIGVWLPEELMEGRISVAITVLLTLSTDSVSSQEHLPTVSYVKAVDIWFAFITAFVFFTLLETLFVIAFDRKAVTLRKRANRKYEAPEERTKLEEAAERYHKLGRYFDYSCRLGYPLIFVCFCMLYFFVITKGASDDCITKKSRM